MLFRSRANLEKFLTYDQSVAGKFHDQKANRALEALQTEHELSLKNIENEAGASLDAEKEKHKARIKRMKKEDDPEDTTPEETTATQKKAIAGVVEEAKAENKLHDQKMADIEKVHEAEKRNVEDISAAKLRAQEKKLQLAEQGMQRELRMAEDLARMHVSDLQQAQREQARWLGQEARDQQKAAGLRNGGVRQIGGAIRGLGGSQDGRDIQRIGGGIFGMGGAGPRRTQAQQQWLDQFDMLQKAKRDVPALQKGIKLNQDQRDQLSVDGSKSLENLLVEQRILNKNLKELLAMR